MRQEIIAGLVVLLLAKGALVYGEDKTVSSPPQGPQQMMEDWLAQMNKEMEAMNALTAREFDSFFNDNFFKHQNDPFGAIRKLPEEFNSLFPSQSQPLFRQSWDGWFKDRMDVTGIHSETMTTKDQVIVSVDIPGLQGESLNVDVNKDRIKMSYSAENKQEKQDAKGNVVSRQESIQQYEKIMPIPSEADPNSSSVERKGNQVQIIFARKHKV